MSTTNKDTESKTIYKFSREEVVIPEWQEYKVSGKEYISWGSKNDMPKFLIEMKDRSAMHNSILQKKALYTYGNGLMEGQKIDQFKLGEEYTLKAIIDDFWLYGMYALEVIWSQDGSEIAHAEHVDMSKLRAGKKDGFGKITHWWYSNDWSDIRKKENTPVARPAYNPLDPTGSQIFVFQGYSSGSSYYSKPSYYGAINYIALDYEISNWHLNNVRNGFTPSMAIIMNDMPDSQEERDYIYKELKKQYGGSTNAGEIVLIFTRDKDHGVELQPIQANDSDTRYEALMTLVRDQILAGHSIVSPLLYGVKTEGQLGGNNELLSAFEITMNTEIAPVQKQIEESLQRVLKLNFMPEFEDSSPVTFAFSESIMKDILSVDEMRDLIGYQPMVQGEESITESNSTTTENINVE